MVSRSRARPGRSGETGHALPTLAWRPVRVVVLLLGCLLVAGCAGGPTALLPTPAATPTLAASRTAPEVTPAPAVPPTETATPAPIATPTATVTPTATATPTSTLTPLPEAEWIALDTTRDGNAEIVLLGVPAGLSTNLTRHPGEDRAPTWRPDGAAIAFESHRDGNWEIYLLDLADGRLARLTDHPAYDGAPAWSPDGSQIAFESARDGNLDIYVMAADGGEAQRLTDEPAGDYGPAWSPDGTTIAFTSWRDGNKEVYAVPAAGGPAANLTQNPADDEDPAWSGDGASLAFVSWRDVDPQTGNRNAEIYRLSPADGSLARLTVNPWPDLDPAWDAAGRLVWSAYVPGPPFETYDPYRPGGLRLFRSAGGGPERLTDAGGDDRRPAPAPAQVASLEALLPLLPDAATAPAPEATPDSGVLAQVVQVPGILAGPDGPPVLLNEQVAPSLLAWQQEVLAATGYDFLHVTHGSWRPVDAVRKKEMYRYDTSFLSWHKAGRALDLAFEYKVDGADQLVQVREDLGADVYWRLYLRTARQDGTQGEPLRENPWRYWWHIVPDHEPEAYDAGGKRLPIPAGYYVDVTEIARRHGWHRIASYRIEGDYHWSTDYNGTEYWHYERTDGLTWWEAMSQIYPEQVLLDNVGWEIGLQHAQSEEMMRSKGVPAPGP